MPNPILPGFHPDPSICRVGDDYYLATSTFEWFPGVALFHSRDLVSWRPIGHALGERRLLDLEGVPDSGGCWAPCLTHTDGLFWLVYTNVRNWGAWMDTPNFLVTAPNIEGPWSEPVFLNSSGFDPSLFHDADGRKWLLNMRWDHRPGKNPFAGIVMQEYDPAARRLIGEPETIFAGTALGRTEGPHVYRKGGYYYLLMAEGGTEYAHAASLARSKALAGPYEADPAGPLLTAAGDRRAPLQKTGHACLVETPAGEWRMVFLCARPLPGTPYCNLGRETAITAVEWTAEGWLRLREGGRLAPLAVPGEAAGARAGEAREEIRFAPGRGWAPALQTLRRAPDGAWLSTAARPGWLRLRGGASLRARDRQSVVARRLEHFRARAEICVEFAPESFQQMAGLAAYYDSNAHYFLHVTRDEAAGRCLRLHDGCKHEEVAPTPVALPPAGPVWLAVEFDHHAVRYEWSLDGRSWRVFGHDLEAARLSDEWGGRLGFTGTMIAMVAIDLAGTRAVADFSHFAYRGEP